MARSMTTDGTRARAFLARMTRHERGSHTPEVAFSIVVIVLIAGLGIFTYGDALAEFFAGFGGGIDETTVPFRDYGTTPLASP